MKIVMRKNDVIEFKVHFNCRAVYFVTLRTGERRR